MPIRPATLLLPTTLLLLSACNRSTEAPAPAPVATAVPAPAPVAAAAPAEATLDNAAAVAAISAERDRLESGLKTLTKKEISFANARAQLKQKWQKMDVYSEGGRVVRVKTYPHPVVSMRTEEFYFKDGALALAFIEDDGVKHEGKYEGRKGKTYWFAGGKLIKEQNDTGEAEASTAADDGIRLLQEAKEYLEIAAAGKA